MPAQSETRSEDKSGPCFSLQPKAITPLNLATATEAGGVTGRYFDEKLRLMDLAFPSEQEERAGELGERVIGSERRHTVAQGETGLVTEEL